MVTLAVKVQSDFATATCEFVFFRGAAQLGSDTAATRSTVSNVTVFAATVDMSGFGAGSVDCVLRQTTAPYSLAWQGTIEIDANGDIVDTTALLNAIKAKADLLGTGNATLSQPVATTGQIVEPIIIGDDYLATHGRAFEWTVDALSGVLVANATCFFGGDNGAGDTWLIEGTVTENAEDSSKWDLSFDVARTDTANLPAGNYEWSVEVRDASNNEVTRVRNDNHDYRAILVAKQT